MMKDDQLITNFDNGQLIQIHLVGCGGTGSEVLDILAQFHLALIARGGQGIHVVAFDPSAVRQPNIVRQRFWPTDIGHNKAITLVNRYNLLLGTSWDASPFSYLEDVANFSTPHILITAVDLPSARCEIARSYAASYSTLIWLDFGNGKDFGQAVLGTLGKNSRFYNVLDHYPEFKTAKDNPNKSCSTLESLLTQDILINRSIACSGMNMLWKLLKHGQTSANLALLDLATGSLNTYTHNSARDL